MKKTILNFGAIVTAFIIGLAINNACADNLGQASDSELRNLVSKLQQEVNTLKNRVAELESKLSTATSSDGGFEVDGIHFNRGGFPDDKIDKVVTSGYYIINGQRTDSESSTGIYEYDSKGRICRQGNGIYTYSNKAYSYITDTDTGTTQTHGETTFHLK